MAINELAGNFDGLKDLLAAGAYMAGAGLGIAAALAMKNHNENPQQHPLSAAIMKMVASFALLALPTFLTTGSDALLGAQDSASAASTSNVASAGGPVVVDPAVQAKVDADKAKADADKAAIVIADTIAKNHALSVKEEEAQALAASAKATAKANAVDKPVDSDIRALLEVLVGFGLVGAGGWALVLRAARKDKASQTAKIDLAIARSADLAEQSQKTMEQ